MISSVSSGVQDRRALWRMRLAHTFIWAFFAAGIIAIPFATCSGHIRAAVWLSLLVWVEVIILVANRMRCPLTAVAARHTSDRSDNFDIFLPLWLARYNQRLFGSLFAVSQLVLLAHLAFGQFGLPAPARFR